MIIGQESAMQVQGRVLGALILRDMRTRFGGSYWSYLIAVLWPFAHIGIVSGVSLFTGVAAPVGDSSVLFFATGVVPYVAFLYTSRNTMTSIVQNSPLLYFPSVKPLDLIAARAILEIVTSFMVLVLVLGTLWIGNIDVLPSNMPVGILGYLTLMLFAVGVGTINGAIAMIYTPWIIGYMLVTITLYLTSGIMYMPEMLPETARRILVYNPLLQYIEWVRSSFYEGYGQTTLSRPYAIGCAVSSVCIGLVLERVLRGRQA